MFQLLRAVTGLIGTVAILSVPVAATQIDNYIIVDTVRIRIITGNTFPTESDAYGALLMEAQRIGADKVINPKYYPNRDRGYMDAEGTAVRYLK